MRQEHNESAGEQRIMLSKSNQHQWNKKLWFLLFPCLNSCLLWVVYSFKSMCNTNACGILLVCSTQHWWLYCGTGEGLAVMSLFWLMSTRQVLNTGGSTGKHSTRASVDHILPPSTATIMSFLHPPPPLSCPSFIHCHHCYVLPPSTAISMSFLHPLPSLCPHCYVLPPSTAIIMSFPHPPSSLLCPSPIHCHHWYILPPSTAIIMSFLHPPPSLLCPFSIRLQKVRGRALVNWAWSVQNKQMEFSHISWMECATYLTK